MRIDARVVTGADRLVQIAWEDGVMSGDEWLLMRLDFEAAGEPRVMVGPGQVVQVRRGLPDAASFVALLLRNFTGLHITGAPDDLFATDEIVNPDG